MYGRTLDGQVLTLAASGWTWMSTFVLWDHETNSIWFGGSGERGWDNLICVGGPLQDSRLSRYEFHRIYWRSWFNSHPESKIMRRRD